KYRSAIKYITMKNKLHTTVCHSAGVSRYKESHSIFYVLFSIFLTLFFIPTHAQPYNWDWAVNGGGSLGESGWDYKVEQVFDIQVGTDNNYYFIAQIKNGTPQLGGQPVTVYGNQLGGNDIFIFSTTCDGTVRWSQTIGGGGLFEQAYKIALDSNNNVYVGANVMNSITSTYPTHFSPTDFLPPWPTNQNTIDAAYKTAYLVKYDTNGQFIWKQALQGDVNFHNRFALIYDLDIDSNNQIHFIIGLQGGTHLDSKVTVPSTITTYQYYAVKYNTLGQYVNSMLLPIPDGSGFVAPSYTFKYDEPRNRYYIGGFRSYVNANEDFPLTYAGTAFTENAYILAIDAANGSEIWRSEMVSSNPGDNRIYDLVVDEA